MRVFVFCESAFFRLVEEAIVVIGGRSDSGGSNGCGSSGGSGNSDGCGNSDVCSK